ncbi:MAG: hypothetical protein IIC11_05845 [Proteobacteria bacterium]|nr:hypothetical protein [Pseudomonadota bacterium]
MFDYTTVGSLIRLVVPGLLWNSASAKVLYMDSDNEPVSLKSIVAFLWLICLLVLICQLFV